MSGPVALVGSGEFTPAMLEIDADLLASTGRQRPRVVVLPTASYPDGEETFQRWATMGTDHFTRLGAEVEPVLVRTRADGDDAAMAQAVGEADLIYLSGGKPGYLLDALNGTAVGSAIAAANARGAVVAGCSAGAMVIASRTFDFRLRALPWPLRWAPGLALAGSVAVIPHYDAWPEPVSVLVVLQSPRALSVLGVDEDTAVVGRDGSWQVHGPGRVTLWRGRHRERFRAGDAFRI